MRGTFGRSEAGPSSAFEQVACDILGMSPNNISSAGQKKIIHTVERFVDNVDRLKDAVISKTDFLQGLDKILPRPATGIPPPPKRLRDAEFDKIASFCKMYKHDAWGLRPRTFVVLYMIGCTDALDGFVAENLSDVSLPYTEENLPRAVRGTKARAQFLNYQKYVLTAHAADLERDGSSHQNVEGSADQFVWTVRELGSGGFGTVDHVISKLSLNHYARKRIPRGRSFKQDRAAIRIFENELKNLKALRHKHLVNLIGSYTDRTFVGLIMDPVADMNLATYLSATTELEHRKHCLRRFFGCLASAINYLHSQKVRHKDIKPENILVKDRTVLLADFGTSHNWADDSKSSTSGTVGIFTRRYCAPEVAASASRNPASDIWSLGCVFIEMGTVLMNRTIPELRKFYEENGTQGHYVRDNSLATDLWIEKLKLSASILEDHQILVLGKSMCSLDPMARPTASELVSEILDLKGPLPYCGYCCDRENETRLTIELQEFQTHHLLEGPEPISEMLQEAIAPQAPEEKTEFTAQSWPLQLPTSSDRFPSVEGVDDDDITLRVPYLAEDDLLPDELESKLEEEGGDVALSHTYLSGCISEGARMTTTSADTANTLLQKQLLFRKWLAKSLLRHLDFSNLICLWPRCHTTVAEPAVFFDGIELLQHHYRSVHGVHEFAWTRLIQKSGPLFASDLDPDSPQLLQEIPELEPPIMGTCNKAVHLPDMWTPQPMDVYSESRDRAMAVKRREILQVDSQDGVASQMKAKEKNVVLDARPQLDQGSTSTSATAKDENVEQLRLSMLPEHKRPEPIKVVHDNRAFDSTTYQITAEALEEPIIYFGSHRPGSPSAAEAPPNQSDHLIPKSSLVPSYFLASTNRFTRREINTSTPNTRLSSFVPPPLFVYGRLMFPSVLIAIAETFTTEEGMYSQALQRRLRTDSSDWALACISLEHAAKQMTPVVLRGYHRWKVNGSWSAAIEKTRAPPQSISFFSKPNSSDATTVALGEVCGFLIFGLSSEALSCLDHLSLRDDQEAPLVSGITLSKDDESRSGGKDENRSLLSDFKRENVEVQIDLKGGGSMGLNAVTYVWNGLRERETPQWDINRFVRSKAFNRLSCGRKGGGKYYEEERKLASIMGMTYVMAGDALCSAILQGSQNKVLELLENGFDINAPCTTYGCALQAAALQGDDEMVNILLQRGADVDARGGHCNRPLIAAIVQGHQHVARTLLAHGADVLADGGQYISAIYQAVNFSDEELTYLLLEKGAWLTTGYRELLDVAAERGNGEIIRRLQEYDVQMLHTRSTIEESEISQVASLNSDLVRESIDSKPVSRSRSKKEGQVAVKPLNVMRAVGFKAIVLKGTKGKWTGIKGVQLMKAALRAGVDPSVLDAVRPFLSSYERMVEFLGRAVNQMNEEQVPNSNTSTSTSTRRSLGQIEAGGDSNGRR